jgi:hypothetical protein
MVDTENSRGGLKVATSLKDDLTPCRAAHSRYNYSILLSTTTANTKYCAEFTGLLNLFGESSTRLYEQGLNANGEQTNDAPFCIFNDLKSTNNYNPVPKDQLNIIFRSKSNEDNRNLLPRFSFEFKTTGSHQLIYSVEVPEFQIPRPSKYDNNFIFNEDGLNEFVNQIHEYPKTVFGIKNLNSTETESSNIPFGNVPV